MLKNLFLVILFALSRFLQAQGCEFLAETSPKVIHSRQILQDIMRSTLLGEKANLILEIEAYNNITPYHCIYSGYAVFDTEEGNQILLREEVYDSCMLRWGGKDALAYIIAHEFGHYLIYQESPHLFSDIDTVKEADADRRGNLYARLAGYNPCNESAFLINKMYEHWIRDSRRYPSQATRLRIAQRACEASDSLAVLFRIANEMMIEQQYENAIHLFDYLLHHFAAPEIYFNAALARIGFALQVKNEGIFRLPLLIDTRTGALRTASGDRIKGRIKYLAQADSLLQIAAHKANMPFIAHIYAKYVHYLQQSPDISPKLRQEVNDLSTADRDVSCEGLITLMQGMVATDSLKAAFFFGKVETFFPTEVAWNLNVLQGKTELSSSPNRQGILAQESIARITTREFALEKAHYLLLSLDTLRFVETTEYLYYVLSHPDSRAKKQIGIQTMPQYSKTTQFGVSLGQSYTGVQQIYDDSLPNKMLKYTYKSLGQETILQYGYGNFNGIIFWFRPDGTLYRWTLYDFE